MKIKGYDHVGICVNNLEESIDFYKNVMGFTVKVPPCPMLAEEEDGMSMLGEHGVTHRTCIMNVAEGHDLELMEFGVPESPVEKPLPMNAVGTHHISYQVEDIDDCIKNLEVNNAECTYKKLAYDTDEGTAYWVLFKDPNGVIFELMQRP